MCGTGLSNLGYRPLRLVTLAFGTWGTGGTNLWDLIHCLLGGGIRGGAFLSNLIYRLWDLGHWFLGLKILAVPSFRTRDTGLWDLGHWPSGLERPTFGTWDTPDLEHQQLGLGTPGFWIGNTSLQISTITTHY